MSNFIIHTYFTFADVTCFELLSFCFFEVSDMISHLKYTMSMSVDMKWV